MIARPNQYELLREAGSKMAEVVREVVAVVGDGVSSLTLEERAREVTEALGARPSYLGYSEGKMKKYPAALCVSINNEIAHSPPTKEKVLKAGDVVSIDFGLEYKGAYMDTAVTVVVGGGLLAMPAHAGQAGDASAANLLRGTKEALEAGIEAARVGGHIGDIGASVEEVAKKYKLGIVKDLRGHGVGAAVHELPHVPNHGRRGEGDRIEEGLVIAIEPIFAERSGAMIDAKDGFSLVTKDGSRAAHFEHTVLCTKSGPEILTK